MLHHISIAAENPEHVAEVLAELWRGRAYPLPRYPNTYIAFADDEHGTAIEVYPQGSEIVFGRTDPLNIQPNPSASGFTATHVAISVPLNQIEIEQLAAREGWQVELSSRGPFLRFVGVWVENSMLLEIMTPDMAAQYRDFMTSKNWEERVLSTSPAW